MFTLGSKVCIYGKGHFQEADMIRPICDLKPEHIPSGYFSGISSEEYHNGPLSTAVSSTGVRDALVTAAHYFARNVERKAQRKETPAMRFGTLVHSALLEPHDFMKRAAVQPDFGDCRSTKNRAEKNDWLTENAGRLIVTAEEYERLSAMIEAVWKQPNVKALVSGGHAEASGYFRHPNGIHCRTRPDYLKPGMIVDLKTTSDASYAGFQKSVANYGYHVQAAMYLMGHKIMESETAEFVFLAVESEYPHALAAYRLDPEAIAKGTSQMELAIERIAECMKTRIWPGHPEGVQLMCLPAWA